MIKRIDTNICITQNSNGATITYTPNLSLEEKALFKVSANFFYKTLEKSFGVCYNRFQEFLGRKTFARSSLAFRSPNLSKRR